MVVKSENEAVIDENLYSTLNEISQESKEIMEEYHYHLSRYHKKNLMVLKCFMAHL